MNSPEKAQLISNFNSPDHLGAIGKLLKDANEIIFCTAFLKQSGLNQIIKKLKVTGTFYVGTDYYLTEPNAIRDLIDAGHTVYLVKKSKATFHPKIYYIRHNKRIVLITGSANITGGGLETNFETSVQIQFNAGSTIDNKFKLLLKTFDVHAKQITDEIELSQYERAYDTYRKKHRKADKDFEKEMLNTEKFDFTEAKKHLKKYFSQGMNEDFNSRMENYRKAKEYLNILCKKRISSPSEFLKYYEVVAKSFYSSGLLRGKKEMARSYKKIIAIIKLIAKNKDESPLILFSKACEMAKTANRFGINALTEIMSTYNPRRFSIANGRTIKSLENLKFKKFPIANNFDENTYSQYNKLLSAISKLSGIKNLAQVDHFLSWYYARVVKPKQDKQKRARNK